MLKEQIRYKDGLPVNCIVAEIDDYPIHFHDDLEVVFVLDGSVILKNGYYTYTLKSGDIFILNDREIHSYYRTNESNTVMILQLDLTYFGKYYDTLKNSFFVTDMKDDDESLELLKSDLCRIILEFWNPEPDYERKIIESAHSLIDRLISDFQYFSMEDGKFINESKNKGNKVLAERLNRITDYLYENYNRRLTLKELAEQEHLSIFYLSHVIKEATGLSFQELLSFIRVEESEKLVLGSNKKIGAISSESGFSAVRYFIKYFTKWFGMHPLEYREKYTGHVQSRDTAARLTIIPEEIAVRMVRSQGRDVYEGIVGNKAVVVTAEVDVLSDRNAIPVNGDQTVENFLNEEYLEPATGILKSFLELKEVRIASGPNYIITKPSLSNFGRKKESFSIFFCNYASLVRCISHTKPTLGMMRDLIAGYEGRMEILIKLTGLAGDYRIVRYKFLRDIVMSCYQKALGEILNTDKRTALMNRWAGIPVQLVEIQHASESLNVQAYLSGFSSELVLIDPL